MSLHPLHSDAPLIVYVDIKSPYAFVAIQSIEALERQLNLLFDWRPLTLDIASYLGSAKKKSGKVVESTRSASQWASVKYAYRDARRYAERQGHVLKGTEKIWDSSLANMGISWTCTHARERLSEYFAQVYPPFWRRELDIEDLAVIERCLVQAGVPVEGFARYVVEDGKVQHDALQSALHPAGIYGVPTFVVDELVLFGREHLPLLRWFLTGREGPAPDMAYEI